MKTKTYNLIDGSSFEMDNLPDNAERVNIIRNIYTFQSYDDIFSYNFKLSLNNMNDKIKLEIAYTLKNKLFKTRTFYLNYYTYYFPISPIRGIFIQMLLEGLGYVYVSDI